MAILKVKKYPDPVLKKRSAEVREISEDIKGLCHDMVDTMIEGSGVGLAAPQIGVLKRIIAVNIGENPKIFINPKVIKKSRSTETMEEGCLSCPGQFLKIKRPKSIELETLNLEGERIQLKAESLLARVLQHEIDHLDGILIIDKASFWEKLKKRKFN